jgi:hypothetical protein
MARDASARHLMKRTSVNPISAKRRGQLVARQETRRIVLGRVARCEAGIDGLCWGQPTDVHEIKTRARGGSITDPDNCLALCRACHAYITEHPQWALEHGYVVHSWAGPAEMSAARRAREQWLFGIEVMSVEAEEL